MIVSFVIFYNSFLKLKMKARDDILAFLDSKFGSLDKKEKKKKKKKELKEPA